MSWSPLLALVASFALSNPTREGSALAAPGDVDADGVPDVIVAGRGARTEQPVVWVLSGRTGLVIHTLRAPSGVGEFGCDVAGVGDVDGDTRPDIVVGADDSNGTRAWGNEAGRALVYSGMNGELLHELCAPELGGHFGRSVAGGGDLDGDGGPDIVVGDPAGGRVFAFSGATGRILFLLDERARRDPENRYTLFDWEGGWRGFGSALAILHDVDGDEHAEVLVGGSWTGEVVLYSGARGLRMREVTEEAWVSLSDTPSASELVDLLPPVWDVSEACSIGDANGDGVPEIATFLQSSQLVRILSGLDLSVLLEVDLLTLVPDPGTSRSLTPDELAHSAVSGAGPVFGPRIGTHLAPAGDLDRDGVIDLMLAHRWRKPWRGTDAPGVVWVLSGRDGRTLFELRPEGLCMRFGSALHTAGDIDGDGVPDLLVGADDHPYPVRPSMGRQITLRGVAFVFSGADGRRLLRLNAPDPEGRFGASVAGGADLDGDGVPELIVSAPSRGRRERGAVHVFSGADGALIRTFRRAGDPGGLPRSSRFGEEVLLLPDEDGDGVTEIAAYLAPESFRIFSGRTGAMLGTRHGRADELRNDHARPERQLWFGEAWCAPGDLDADECVDLVFASEHDGELRALSGATGRVIFSVKPRAQ